MDKKSSEKRENLTLPLKERGDFMDNGVEVFSIKQTTEKSHKCFMQNVDAFIRRFEAVILELAEIQSRLEYLSDYIKEYKKGNKIFDDSPHFIKWTEIASWHDILQRFSNLFEERSEHQNIKNIPKLHKFVMINSHSIYNKQFSRTLTSEKQTITEEVELHTLSFIDEKYSMFMKTHNVEILKIIDYRDNKLAHITFKNLESNFNIESMKTLLTETEKLTNIYRYNFDNTYHTVNTYSLKDHNKIFFRFNAVEE